MTGPPADRARLDALVGRAHGLGLWVRFYTLNGHAPNAQGWSDGYNFGSLAAVQPRWRAAIEAGVNFIATDQYRRLRGDPPLTRRRSQRRHYPARAGGGDVGGAGASVGSPLDSRVNDAWPSAFSLKRPRVR